MPQRNVAPLRARWRGRVVVVGPHASTTPRTALAQARRGRRRARRVRGGAPAPRRRLGARALALLPPRQRRFASTAGRTPRAIADLPALAWPAETVRRHRHHHHRFDAPPAGPGAEVEVVARLPLPLHLLRERQLPRRLPQAAARNGARGDRRADRRRRRLRLLHRRDLPAQPPAAGGARRAARPLGHADAHRPVDPGDARTARDARGASPSKPAWRASPRRAARCSTRVPALHRADRRTADLRPAARAVRAGQPARHGAGRPRGRGSLARASARARRVGQQAGAPVPLPRLARICAPLGRPGRRGVGTRAGALPDRQRELQRHPGAAVLCRWCTWNWTPDARVS